ncbi:MAG: DUF3276 family protein [Bacteroidetes bacterium]|nr:DUF3276 family protein [Bacteroidota bacterium]
MDDFQHENREEVYSQRIRAGKRTYFIDVKPTKAQDYYITITESKKMMDGGYMKHKIFLYKEDFDKFTEGLGEAINHVKTQLMPEVDFSQFNRPDSDGYNNDGNGGGDGGDGLDEFEKGFDKI